VSGPIKFGALPSLATHILPAALCKWRERHKTSSLTVSIMNQLELTPDLMRGDLDFIIGLTDFYSNAEGLRQRVLFRDRLRIVARPSHPAFHISGLSWASLAQFPWVMYGGHRSLLEMLLKAEGLGLPQQLTDCGSVDFIKSLIAESDSLALIPSHAIATDVVAGRLRSLDFGATELGRAIAVVFRERSPLQAASRELVQEIEAAGLALGQRDYASGLMGDAANSMPRVTLRQRNCPEQPPV
jgi:DNA-binding transcriptional LysR family regulator